MLNSLGNGVDPVTGENFTAYGLGITFDTEDAYKAFVDNSGLKIGVKSDNNQQAFSNVVNGKPVVYISKSLLGDVNFFNRFHAGLNAVNDAGGIFSGYRTPHGYSVVGTDETWTKLGARYNGWNDDLESLFNFVDDVDNTYKEEIASKYNKVIPSGLQVSGFINDKQRQIVNMVGTGRLEREMGNFMLKQINDYYDNQLSGISLTGFEDVYATKVNDETKNLMPIEDSKTRNDLTDMIRAAAKENRVTVRAATAGGRVGASITIAAKLDNEGKPVGNYGGAVEIFIPGLFEEDARNVMDQDLDAKLLVEKSEHIAFNHSYFLEDGGKICDFAGDGSASYEDDLGRRFLTPEEVDNLMRQNEMIKGTANQLKKDIAEQNLDDASATELAQQYAKKIYSYMNDVPESEIDTSQNNIPTTEGNLTIDRMVKLILSNLKQ